jgi:hypothetical protein
MRRQTLVALLIAVVTTLTLRPLVAPAAHATSRSDREVMSRASLRYCADPGYCGGNMTLSVSRAEASATPFTRAWARDWNTWAAAHMVPQHIVTAGCNYLSTERYYLCAVRVSSHAAASPGESCGLIVLDPRTQPSPNAQIANGLETSCRILSAFPQQLVD